MKKAETNQTVMSTLSMVANSSFSRLVEILLELLMKQNQVQVYGKHGPRCHIIVNIIFFFKHEAIKHVL